jgi:molybdopterin molybdotransferase
MITVAEAEKIIQSQIKNYGTENVPFESSVGRVLAEDLFADRDLPPYDRVAMDGIAIKFSAFQKGIRSFAIRAIQAAGETPVDITDESECIEIMTGAALPSTADTVIRYEDVNIKEGVATVKCESVKQRQNVHGRGTDKKQQERVAIAPQRITPAVISLAASIGKVLLSVRKTPRVVIISTGDELVDVDETPSPFQIRRSNNYTIKAALRKYVIEADSVHIPDDLEITRQQVRRCIEEYDVILLSGGVSMGKFDYVPQALQELSVEKLFHRVQQRPGKPFWFGAHPGGALVFAFPGNPVSTFMCLHRYFIPWLRASLGETAPAYLHATLNEDVTFNRPLQYLMLVKIAVSDTGQLLATPVDENGSGDFTSLLQANAFMELPAEKSTFKKGEIYKLWVFCTSS